MTGLFAAVATPVTSRRVLDLDVFDRLLEFLVRSGVDGVCIGGATGEYPHFSAADRLTLIERTRRQVRGRTPLVVGVGAPSASEVVLLGRAAADSGAEALLLPSPIFFRYQQSDLRAYFAEVSREVAAPCLLYDLPDFTNPIAPATALGLMRDEPFIRGIKDSSGRAENLANFAAARDGQPWTLFVGDDRLLARGLSAGWDGGISGVAGFCPELMVRLHRSARDGDESETARLQRLLEELIGQISIFPTPWGIRIGLAARGLATGPLPLPLTAERRRQIADFQEWFPAWLARNLSAEAVA